MLLSCSLYIIHFSIFVPCTRPCFHFGCVQTFLTCFPFFTPVPAMPAQILFANGKGTRCTYVCVYIGTYERQKTTIV